jgi:hypothetical protein
MESGGIKYAIAGASTEIRDPKTEDLEHSFTGFRSEWYT